MDAVVVKLLQDHIHALSHCKLVSSDVHLRVHRLLVGSVKACEAFDLALAGLLVEALRISSLDGCEGCIHEDLHEGQRGVLVDLARVVAVCGVGRDEPGDDDGPGLCEELGHLRDASDVLFAVAGAEAQIPVQPEPQVVTIQAVHEVALGLRLDERALQGDADGALAAAGEARHPERDALVAVRLPLLLAGEALVKLDVGALHIRAGNPRALQQEHSTKAQACQHSRHHEDGGEKKRGSGREVWEPKLKPKWLRVWR